jgi:hypothetical protein
MLLVDFGDGQSQLFQLSPQPSDKKALTYTLSVSHVYNSEQQSFTIQATIADHLGSSKSAQLPIKFESNLPSFVLITKANVTDPSQMVFFQLVSTSTNNTSINVSKIVVYFDYPNNLGLSRYTFKNSKNQQINVCF